jgi:glucan phosphoethanolaminetransferase (alkaline phosphatase superfamily)
MKLIERACLTLSLLGILLKLLLIRSGNPVLIISASLLSFVYFYFGFALLNGIGFRAMFKKASYANISTGRILGAIGVGFFLSIILIGLLFKLMIWNGAQEMITIGATGLFMVLLAACVVMVIKRKSLDSFYKGIFVRGGVALLLAVIVFLTPGRSLIRIYHRDNPAFAELMIKALENPQDEELQKQYEEAREKEYNK